MKSTFNYENMKTHYESTLCMELIPQNSFQIHFQKIALREEEQTETLQAQLTDWYTHWFDTKIKNLKEKRRVSKSNKMQYHQLKQEIKTEYYKSKKMDCGILSRTWATQIWCQRNVWNDQTAQQQTQVNCSIKMQ